MGFKIAKVTSNHFLFFIKYTTQNCYSEMKVSIHCNFLTLKKIHLLTALNLGGFSHFLSLLLAVAYLLVVEVRLGVLVPAPIENMPPPPGAGAAANPPPPPVAGAAAPKLPPPPAAGAAAPKPPKPPAAVPWFPNPPVVGGEAPNPPKGDVVF